MAFIKWTEKKINKIVERKKNPLFWGKGSNLSGQCWRISRILNWRTIVTRYIPILCIILVWHLMIASKYQLKQPKQKSVVHTTRDVKIMRYRDIIVRLSKENRNIMKEINEFKSTPPRKTVIDGGQMQVVHFTKPGESAALRRQKRLRLRQERGRIAKNEELTRQIAIVDKLVEDLKKQNIPSIAAFKMNLTNEIYGSRIASIIKGASRFGSSNNVTHTPESPDTLSVMGSNFIGDKSESLKPPLIVDTNFVRQTEPSPAARQLQSSSYVDGPIKGLQPTNKQNYTLCNAIPAELLGRVFVDFNHTHNMTRQDVLRQHPDLQFGGMWHPPNCVARHRVAIIIPYRDREQHLVTLLSHLLPILKRQELNFRIFVTEQIGNDTFNKARIMNAAFKEAIKLYDFQCFVFHDVDLIPEDDRNMYSCPVQPRHMSVAIDEMDYKVPYDYLVGGVLSMRTEHFQMVNGYSNLYWGWGAEDDDLAFRIIHVGLKITRPPSKVARYKMIKHEKRTPTDWRKRSRLLRTGVRRFNFDGLNSVNYKLISIKNTPLFTHILVDIGKPPSLT